MDIRRALGGLFVALMMALSLIAVIPAPSLGAEADVAVRDNRFVPQELQVDVGDRVTWTHQGNNVHDVTSDTGAFASPDLTSGDTFSRTFNREGFFFYHCSFHGATGQVGMWGVVVVGDPPPPPDPGGGGDKRDKLIVPRDFDTIQEAVDAASPKTTIVVRPGRYVESVVVRTSDITIRGVDRFRTRIHGEDRLINGIHVDGASDVKVKNLTVRNFTGTGVFLSDSSDYTVAKVDSIKNRTYGIYAFDSYQGVIKESFAYGSGDAAFYVGQCLGCSTLLDRVKATTSYFGYSGTNATGVVIIDSTFARNAVGVVPNSGNWEDHAPNRGTTIIGNTIRNNNYSEIPPAGTSATVGVPIGTGVWLWGVANNSVVGNSIEGHDRYGVLISRSLFQDFDPINNRVTGNDIGGSGLFDVAIESGTSNCLADNSLGGPTGPPDAQVTYHCAVVPFENEVFTQVRTDVESQYGTASSRAWSEPPEPDRPRCQRGKPGCNL